MPTPAEGSSDGLASAVAAALERAPVPARGRPLTFDELSRIVGELKSDA